MVAALRSAQAALEEERRGVLDSRRTGNKVARIRQIDSDIARIKDELEEATSG